MNPSIRIRPRRLRRSSAVRALAAETRLHPDRFIQPHFVVSGDDVRRPVTRLPGIDRVGVDGLLADVENDLDLGIRTVLLFGAIDDTTKDPDGRSAAETDGPVPCAVRSLKGHFGDDVTVMTDVCLCGYTTHGHCGVLGDGDRILNDPSLRHLADMALCHADAGADWIAPSDMMDGRIGFLRSALDAVGHIDTAILGYSVKYASAYYGPFRDAVGSSPTSGDRSTYQMDARNVREAVREARLDEEEGADALMVKPALAYLDVVRALRGASDLPLACYNVSGEYAMVKAAARAGLVDEAAIVRENLTSMVRAGADWIITYHARQALAEGWLA